MPAKARDLIRALSRFGVSVSPPRSGSSHWLAQRAGKVYPIPLHNGEKTELSDVYLRGVCRAFDIDFAALKKEL